MLISTLLLCTITSLCGEAGPNYRPFELLFRVQEILHSIKLFRIFARNAHESSSGMHFVDIQKGFR